MKRTAIRGVCLLILLASIAVRFQANRARETMMSEFDVGAAVTELIRQHGYVVRENPVKPPAMLSGVIYFQRPECERVSLVLPHFINEETQTLLMRAAPGSGQHFFYLGGSWNERAQAAMFLEWARYAVLDIFGASPYIPVKKAIVLAEAPDCHPAADIDWRPVWEKDRRRGVAGSVATHMGT